MRRSRGAFPNNWIRFYLFSVFNATAIATTATRHKTTLSNGQLSGQKLPRNETKRIRTLWHNCRTLPTYATYATCNISSNSNSNSNSNLDLWAENETNSNDIAGPCLHILFKFLFLIFNHFIFHLWQLAADSFWFSSSIRAFWFWPGQWQTSIPPNLSRNIFRSILFAVCCLSSFKFNVHGPDRRLGWIYLFWSKSDKPHGFPAHIHPSQLSPIALNRCTGKFQGKLLPFNCHI